MKRWIILALIIAVLVYLALWLLLPGAPLPPHIHFINPDCPSIKPGQGGC